MIEADFPFLSFIIIIPLVGAILTGSIRSLDIAKHIALFVAILTLLLSIFALILFDTEHGGFQLVERYEWIPLLNIEYLVGVDGISILFLPMTALLTLITMLAVWNSTAHLPRFHFSLLLALEGVSFGIFCALDTVLFFLFWELTLPPFFFLIGLWGIGSQRRSAAMKYLLYMIGGGVPILLAFILLASNHAYYVEGLIPQELSFSLPVLLDTPLPDNLQAIVFLLLLFGFAIKAPLVPLHTWMPTAAMEGPTHIVALLVGLKLGVYGILRFAMPLAPAAAVDFSWLLSVIGAVTLIYAALIALQQTNLRRLLAYASVSHVGLVIVGIASLTAQGFQGAIFQLLNFTFIASSLMLIAGFIHHRIGSTETIHLGGLAKVMPKLTFFYFLFMLSSIGLPGTSGFPAELLMIIGALNTHSILGFAALSGAILSAAYMLSYTRKAFLGPVVHKDIEQVIDIKSRELALLFIPALLALIFGLFPEYILNINQAASDAWLSRLTIQSP
ncbi:NADH dehydrogenase subunit M [Nitrosomonas marina]|uniref:NADH dehydrogenase subunit M n=1 Tax=Nitrosomonas marina TaxID=917 RepID=A0A1H9YYD5_9PROT|nr:NADH-quinone oxidoreductase subunit M [Nitrosomonas marina]SES74270.1 NADH dehydrogenase subunit M [Nitrosomonas marina]